MSTSGSVLVSGEAALVLAHEHCIAKRRVACEEWHIIDHVLAGLRARLSPQGLYGDGRVVIFILNQPKVYLHDAAHQSAPASSIPASPRALPTPA